MIIIIIAFADLDRLMSQVSAEDRETSFLFQ